MIRILLSLIFITRLIAAEAEDLAVRGRFSEAADLYLAEARGAAGKDRRDTAIPALMNAVTCMKMSGDISAAALHVATIREWMGDSPPPEAYLEWLALKGSVLALGKRPSLAIEPLQEALDRTSGHPDHGLEADLYNDLGIALSSGGKHQEAMAAFERAAARLRERNDGQALLRARQNQVVAAFQAWSESDQLVRRIKEVNSWPGDAAARLRLASGRLDAALNTALGDLARHDSGTLLALHLRLTVAMAAHRSGSTGLANRQFAMALELARSTGKPGFESSALLGLAEQYLDAGRFADALNLLTPVRESQDSLEENDLARLEILTAECRHAVDPGSEVTGDAIRRAVASVESIRSDLARSQYVSDLGRGFREFAGRPYLLLADHLLHKSGDDQTRLREARDAIESFKTWELNDFYRDDCVNLALESSRDLDHLGDPTTAVIYLIPLDDRTEILVGHDSGLRRMTSAVGSAELLAAARRFRYRLESDYGTYRFLDEAEFLHSHLIAPIKPALDSLGIRHLVFVPDGALGNMPLGALYDPARQRYLLEDYSVSIAPNLSLLGEAPADDEARPLLVGGLSEAAHGFPAIPAVAGEIEAVAALYPEKVRLQNREFTTQAIRDNLLELPVDVVHFASHGEFLGRADGCFLLAHDGRITLDQIEEMIRPKKFVGTPVGLLCLSACRTAAGDDRAALGLAGAGVKSGARSVLATLWYVDDVSTAGVMTSFHRHLQALPDDGKAEAIRQAQLGMIREDPNAHPSLWAPFVLVGSWQ